MDLQTLSIVVILASVVAMLVRTMMRGIQRPSTTRTSTLKKLPAGTFALDDSLDKINETIRILQDTLDTRAPGRSDPDGGRFYIAYLVGIAREVAKMNGVAYGPALETPIRMELIRLDLGSGDSDQVMSKLMASSEGQQGLAAGELDGREACDPAFKGIYFERIQTYFQDTGVRGDR